MQRQHQLLMETTGALHNYFIVDKNHQRGASTKNPVRDEWSSRT